MYHPACWIIFSATTALLFIPGMGEGGSLFPGRFRDVREEEWEGEPRGEERECELHVRERGRLAVCTRIHIRSLTHTHADACSMGFALCSRQCDLVSWVRDLHHAVRHCCCCERGPLALTSCGPRGRRRGMSAPRHKSFSLLMLGPAGLMGDPYFSIVISLFQSPALYLPVSLPVSFLSLFSISFLSLSPSSLFPLFLQNPLSPTLFHFSSFLSPSFSVAPEFLVLT